MSEDANGGGRPLHLPDIPDESTPSLPELKRVEPLSPPEVLNDSPTDSAEGGSSRSSRRSTTKRKDRRTQSGTNSREDAPDETDDSAEDNRRRSSRRRTSNSNTRQSTGGESVGGDIPPAEVDRVFTLLEEALAEDALGTAQFNQLLGVLERGIANPTETDPETLSEVLSMLEELLIEPDELDPFDVGGFLRIFEQALEGTTGADDETISDLFGLLEEAVRDPTAIQPDDIEQLRRNLEATVTNIADPTALLGGLFGATEDDEYLFDPEGDDEPVDMAQLGRIAAALTQRATGYSLESGLRTGTRMAYAAANSKSPAELVTNTRAITLDELQRAGIDIGEDQTSWLATYDREAIDPRPATRESLVERGERLLEQSAEVGRDEAIHPAFSDILDNLSPDEARILRLLAMDGPQPALDVYDRSYLPWKLKPVAQNLTMLGSDAGCRTPVRTPAYLQNLQRLGVVEVVGEPIDELKRYQVLEAQSHVESARDSAKRQRTSYKSVRLTDFGVAFCEMCFPFSVTAIPQTAKFREGVDS